MFMTTRTSISKEKVRPKREKDLTKIKTTHQWTITRLMIIKISW